MTGYLGGQKNPLDATTCAVRKKVSLARVDHNPMVYLLKSRDMLRGILKEGVAN